MEFHHGHDQFLEDSNINGFGINEEFDENTLLCTTFLESSSANFEAFCMPPFINFDPQTLNCFSSSSSYGHDQHYINPPNYDYEQLHGVAHDHDHNIKLESSPLMVDQDYYSMFALLDDDDVHENYCHDNHLVVNKQQEPQPCFEIGKGKGKKKKMMSKLSLVDDVKGGMGSGGQPSKNLMAERRRRKRLNDRLSMLRSIVPNITKMDRTSILGDTIDYMKELIHKINHMQQQMDLQTCTHQHSTAKPLPKDQIFITNSPKFEVERRNRDTVDVKICCMGKPEVLISTITTLEGFGLQIHESVITCFNNDFEMHASCTTSHSQVQEVQEQSVMQDTEDLKQALFRSAGYGGKCL